jgi:hypothetical protein
MRILKLLEGLYDNDQLVIEKSKRFSGIGFTSKKIKKQICNDYNNNSANAYKRCDYNGVLKHILQPPFVNLVCGYSICRGRRFFIIQSQEGEAV